MSGNKIRILAKNVIDGYATITASPALLAMLPELNLVNQTERQRTGRTTSLASQDINLTWAAAQRANMFAQTRGNYTTGMTLRGLLYQAGSPSVSSYDSTALALFSTAGLNTNFADYRSANFANLRNVAHYFALKTDVAAATFRNTDAANPDGYIEYTKLWMGEHFEFTYSPPFGGASLTLMDASISGRSDDGTHIVAKKWKARKLDLNMDFIPDADLDDLMTILQEIGTDKEVFISLYPGLGGTRELFNQMACRCTNNPVVNPHVYGLHKTTIVFEET